MSLTDDIVLLKKVDLFCELGEDKLRLIAFGAERRKLLPGQVLFRENTPADCAFVVAEGRFEVSRTARDTTKEPLGSAGPGTLLGELALITQVMRTLTVIASEPSEIMRINRPLFRRMLEEYPDIAGIIEARIARNLDEMATNLGILAPRFMD